MTGFKYGSSTSCPSNYDVDGVDIDEDATRSNFFCMLSLQNPQARIR